MNDYMVPQSTHTANIASISAVSRQYIQPKFHCFLSTLTKSEDPIFFKHAVTQKNWVNAEYRT